MNVLCLIAIGICLATLEVCVPGTAGEVAALVISDLVLQLIRQTRRRSVTLSEGPSQADPLPEDPAQE